MTHSNIKTPRYPKGHLLAASGLAAFLSLSLLVFPSAEVEAKRTTINLDLPQTMVTGLEETHSSVTDAKPPFQIASGTTDEISSLEPGRKDANPLGRTSTIALDPGKFLVTAIKGDTLTSVFMRANISRETLNKALTSSKEFRRLKVQVGQIFEFQVSSGSELEAVHSKLGNLDSISLTRTEKGFEFKSSTIKPATRSTYAYGVINSSLSNSAEKAGLPHSLVLDMADIFAYDIDFSKVDKNDQFEVVYEQKVVNDKVVGTGKILAARFTNLRKTYTAIRYTNGSYYNAQGISLRKAFLRTPVDFARISSRFSSGRKHPILNKIRAHQGVDYAAPRGTPIKAAGDGKVLLAGRKGGYGNTIILQHGSSYKTLYAHMQGFAKGIRNGAAVRQGQIIGYIGTTGLSTGPHLHYEFQVNGRHVDPLGQKSLTADPIASSEKTKFMKLSQPLLAKMDRDKSNMLAMSKP